MSRDARKRAGTKGQVDSAIGQVDDLVGRADVQPDVGMPPGELAHERRHDVAHEPDRPGEANDACISAIGGMCGGVLERLGRAHGFPGGPEQRLPVLGE